MQNPFEEQEICNFTNLPLQNISQTRLEELQQRWRIHSPAFLHADAETITSGEGGVRGLCITVCCTLKCLVSVSAELIRKECMFSMGASEGPPVQARQQTETMAAHMCLEVDTVQYTL